MSAPIATAALTNQITSYPAAEKVEPAAPCVQEPFFELHYPIDTRQCLNGPVRIDVTFIGPNFYYTSAYTSAPIIPQLY
jgi:hypothetical protein